MTIHKIITLVKRTNLVPFYETMIRNGQLKSTSGILRDHYTRDRDVTMQLMIGTNMLHQSVALIKCPINPLPVCGEFQIPSEHALIVFLKGCGWTIKNELPYHLLPTYIGFKK